MIYFSAAGICVDFDTYNYPFDGSSKILSIEIKNIENSGSIKADEILSSISSLKSCDSEGLCEGRLFLNGNSNFRSDKNSSDFSLLLAESHFTYHLALLEKFLKQYQEMPLLDLDVFVLKSLEAGELKNAYFNSSPYGDELIFGTYEGIPMHFDPDIIYHEYGHAIFYKLAGIGSGDFLADFDLREAALSEGLADFFTYFVSGNTKIASLFHESTGTENLQRDLELRLTCPDSLTGYMHFDGRIVSSYLYRLKNFIELEKIEINLFSLIVAALQNGQNIESFLSRLQEKAIELYPQQIKLKQFISDLSLEYNVENCADLEKEIKSLPFKASVPVNGRGDVIPESDYFASGISFYFELDKSEKVNIELSDQNTALLHKVSEKPSYGRFAGGFEASFDNLVKSEQVLELKAGRHFFRLLSNSKNTSYKSFSIRYDEADPGLPSKDKEKLPGLKDTKAETSSSCQLNRKLNGDFNRHFIDLMLTGLTLFFCIRRKEKRSPLY